MWQTDNQNNQVLQWKYGKVLITSSLNIPKTAIVITIHKFSSLYPNCFSMDTSSDSDKTLINVQKIINYLQQIKANRHSEVYIIGGGMLLDLGAFACSIYMRGIHKVHLVPTTLLAMVDAGVGGKNGINYNKTKNLLGTIRHANSIIIHLDFVASQTLRQFASGLAEVIKMAITYDKQFFQYLQNIKKQQINNLQCLQNRDILLKIVKKSIALKISVVQIDPMEQNERKWLNFGHTVGHGIELASGCFLLHGECVSVGMIKALQLSLLKGILPKQNKTIISRLRKLLLKVNLPIQIPTNINVEQIVHSMQKDKKKTDTSNVIQFVFVKDIGLKAQKTTKVNKREVQFLLSKAVSIHYQLPLCKQINTIYKFLGSKSISLRLIFMAALSWLKFQQRTQIRNFLTSEDADCMLNCLRALGFHIQHNEQERTAKVTGFSSLKSGTLDVGNSGITARFILPLCASLPGRWRIICQPRMSERPNVQIIELCAEHFDCTILCQKQQKSYPLTIHTLSRKILPQQIVIDGTQSSQYISAVMLYAAFTQEKLTIRTCKEHFVSESYLHMTAACLNYYNISTIFQGSSISIDSKSVKHAPNLSVQTDLSTLSYPYIFSLIHNLETPTLPTVSIQGELIFYSYTKQMLECKEENISFDFNNCTDTFMTMAVFFYVASLPAQLRTMTIYNIANQRVKQSNRIHLTASNLQKVGCFVQEYQNQIVVHKRSMHFSNYVVFETANDHRLAMSMAIMATYLSKIHPDKTFIIDDKDATKKTFPQFWNYLEQTGMRVNGVQVAKQRYHKQQQKAILIVGNRGSGKSTIGQNLAQMYQQPYVDLDVVIIQKMKQQLKISSIQQYVQRNGWDSFREFEANAFQKILAQHRNSVITTGGGITHHHLNRFTLQRYHGQVVYLERKFQELRIVHNQNRPQIPHFKAISVEREKHFLNLSSLIVNIPTMLDPNHQVKFVDKCIKTRNNNLLRQGYILCYEGVPSIQIIQNIFNIQKEHNFSAIQFRLDYQLKNESMQSIRQKIAIFKNKYQLPTILTLRTKKQLGLFQGNYEEQIKNISKIPSQFMDHQTCFPLTYSYNFNNLIASYHGLSQYQIERFFNFINNPFQGIGKLCLHSQFKTNTHQLYQNYKYKLSSMKIRTICVDLNNPLTRLENKFQMVKWQGGSLIGLKTVSQMSKMKQLLKLIR